MAASLSGSRITLSGAYSLGQLTGLDGVTVQSIVGTVYPLTIYTLTGRQLTVASGAVGSMSSREKLIFTGQGATGNILDVQGTLSIGEVYTRNGYATNLPIEAMVFALSSSGTWNTTVLNVQGAGKLLANNAIFRIPHSIWFNQNTSGQVLLENCVIDKRGSVGDIQTNHSGSGNNSTVLRNCTIYADGQAGLTFRNAVPPTIENVRVVQARDAWNNESNSYKVIMGLVPDQGNLVDVAQWADNTTVIVNAQKGTQFKWGGHLETSPTSNTGSVSVYQEVNGTVKTPSGVAVSGAVFYISDTAVTADPAQTSVFTKTGATVNPTVRQTYIRTSDVLGNFATLDVLIGTGLRTVSGAQIVGGNANRVRPRGKNTTALSDATDDLYDYSIWSYAHLPQTNPVALKSGTGSALSLSVSATTDAGVTLTQAQASALTQIVSLDQIYDAAKDWKCQAQIARIEYPSASTQPVNGNGTVQELGSRTLVIDGTVAATFAINTATNTITVKSSTLAKGAKFDTIQAAAITVAAATTVSANLTGPVTNSGTLSGTITGNVTNSGALSGATITGSVTQATPTNLSGVTITGNLTYSTNTPVTITLTNTAISGTVSNTGTGLVTITLASGSTIGTVGSNVITQRFANVTAPNIIVGSRVQLYDLTNNVELYNAVLTAPLNYQHTYVGDITVRLRAAYQTGTTAKLPVEATGLLTLAGLSFLDTQSDDSIYIMNNINGSTCTEFSADNANVQIDIAGTTSTTAQRLYAFVIYNDTTASGIANLFNPISATDEVNYLIDQSVVNLRLDNTGATPIKISGGVITRKDGTTVIAATSGSIQIDPAKAYVANSAKISIDLQTIKNYTAASV